MNLTSKNDECIYHRTGNLKALALEGNNFGQKAGGAIKAKCTVDNLPKCLSEVLLSKQHRYSHAFVTELQGS